MCLFWRGTSWVPMANNGWMDQDATWYGDRPRPRPHCIRWGPMQLPQGGTTTPPLFSAHVISWRQTVASLVVSATAEHLYKRSPKKRKTAVKSDDRGAQLSRGHTGRLLPRQCQILQTGCTECTSVPHHTCSALQRQRQPCQSSRS